MAIARHCQVLHQGSDEVVSLGVWSDGTHYGFSEGIYVSLPVVVKDGKYTIVDGFELCKILKEKVEKSNAELLGERKTVLE